MEDAPIGAQIRKLRKAKDIRQEDLAERTGISRQTIIKIEKLKHEPSKEQALKLLRALGEMPQEPREQVCRLKMGGVIMAGRATISFDYDEEITVPVGICGPQCIALRVVGESMIDDHIVDGDIVLMQPQIEAPPRSLVVATIDGMPVLKRYYPMPDRIELRSRNSEYPPIVAHPERIEIKGIVVALIRTKDFK